MVRKCVQPVGRIVAGGMLREGTPVEDYTKEYGLWVKREDRACPPPGPAFSKSRGVYAWVKKQQLDLVGVLDTYHSQAGHSVARACQVLGKQCINYYPEFKYEPGPRGPQLRAQSLGATLRGLPAGRSAILFHAARKDVTARGGVMIPNALKLVESVHETAREVPADADRYGTVIVPVSSGTIAAGVIQGFLARSARPKFVLHLGYSRSHDEVTRYVRSFSGVQYMDIVDEGYTYKDQSAEGPTPPWPCNPYYDLKAFRWWMREGRLYYFSSVLFWNIG